ncbi:hypothetical protein [Burkholderia pseudomultivorans]|uniref:hypothetical protein n=1 Tax=Burkholderia pseudomultivorans TaxID=1207504 RepID=UPI0011862A2E|nr:hypothetical protein [Burkholderia pseudomultivorans]MBF5008066.1 hypothetical protein [Burkholderia pseudomultivorans]
MDARRDLSCASRRLQYGQPRDSDRIARPVRIVVEAACGHVGVDVAEAQCGVSDSAVEIQAERELFAAMPDVIGEAGSLASIPYA